MKKGFLKVKNSQPFIIAKMGILRENKGGRRKQEESKYSLVVNKNKIKQKIILL